MTSVNSTSPSSIQPKSKHGTAYKWANKFFKAPTTVDRWTKNGMAKDDAVLSGTRKTIRGFIGNRVKELVDYDYREFPALVIGKHSIPLSEPPKGALLLLLYPGTVIPRLYRAYQRGKQNNDYREMGDVLRRDLTAITLFVFALGPVVRNLSKLTEKLSGVKLLDPNSKQVLKYSQFKNYEIDSERALKAILTEDNGHALLKAVNKLHDRGLARKYGEHNKEFQELNNGIKGIKNSVKELVEQFEAYNKPKDGAEKAAQKVWPKEAEVEARKKLDELAGKAMEAFNHAEKLREDALTAAKKGGSAEMAKVAEKMRGEFKGVLQNSAKAHRLPSDLVSFAILVGAIGYLPMWINTEWNKRQFEKKMAAKKSAAEVPGKPAVPTPAGTATQTPAFGLKPFGTVNTFAQPMFSNQFANRVQPQWAAQCQPFAALPSQMQQNPFNRQA